MEVALAAKVATALAPSVLSPLLNKLSSKFGGDVTDEEMKHLDKFVRYEIEAVIEALTREANSDQSTSLLEELQDAALEVVDLLDLYEYDKLEKQVSSSSSNPIKKFVPKFKETMGPMLFKSPLRKGVEKLLKFKAEVEKLHPVIMSRKGTTQPPPATNVTSKTSTPSSPFYGRGDQYDMIIKLLLDESHADLNSRTKNVSIIAIRGLGGAGKTTIAQHIYNENKIEKYFNLRMWVDVTLGFDESRLIKEVIESATKETCPQISNLDVLQTKLKESVSEEKFLVVLDNVWEENTAIFDIVLGPLKQVGVKGSKIIVTTRTEKVAQDLHAKPIILLDELKDEDCWSILKHHAIDDNDETIESLEELKYVGNQIISKELHVWDCDELMQLPPNDTLRTFCLVRCPKLTPPSMFKKSPGFSDLSFLPNLVALKLGGLPNVQALADFSFLTNIEVLELSELPNLQALANLSPTVTYLRIIDCPKLASLGNLQRCTSLKELTILKCPMVRREEASLVEGVVEGDIANRLPHLEEFDTDEPLLVLELIQQQAFSSINRLYIEDCAAAALPNLEMLSSLEALVIWNSPDIESLPKLPVSLEILYVYDCPKLKEMHEEGGPLHLDLKGLSYLEKLSNLIIDSCPAIELLPNLPDSLRMLWIEECPAIELLPNLPDSLQNLWINECPKLKEKYEEGGLLRHTISRIPQIHIW